MSSEAQVTDVSVVVPLLNEQDSLRELAAWIDRVMAGASLSYEIIFIDDGSTDSSLDVIRSIADGDSRVRYASFARNYGKSAALYTGFEMSRGSVVITMDADLQDSPDEIPALYAMITEQGYDMVSGWKRKRYDPIGKRLPSKFFNFTARCVSGIRLHDFNCGLKAYSSRVVKSVEVYGEMHRYIPILASRAGFTRIGEKEVAHRARRYGVSKFGWERMVRGYLDLITVMFMSKFGRSPMYFFGSLGTLMFLFGAVSVIWIIVQKIARQASGAVFRPVTDQPLFFLCLAAVILGVIFFMAGFIGELVNRNSPGRNDYRIKESNDN